MQLSNQDDVWAKPYPNSKALPEQPDLIHTIFGSATPRKILIHSYMWTQIEPSSYPTHPKYKPS